MCGWSPAALLSSAMDVRVVDHPLAAARLTTLRDERTDNSKARFLETHKIPLRRISGIKPSDSEADAGLMHQKFAVIDRANVLTGSYNWTRAAELFNHENLLLFRNAGPLAEEGVLHRTHAPMKEGRHVSSAAYVDWVMSAAAVEVRSDLPDTGAAIDVGTDVVTRDGHRLGTIEAIDVDEERHVRGYVVREALFHRLDLVIPEDMIDAVTDDRVRLAADADDLRFVATRKSVDPPEATA